MRLYFLGTLLTLIFAIPITGQTNREFTINGKFPSSYYDGLTVYLNEIDYANTNQMLVKDSATVVGDQFTFKGTVEKSIALRYITLPDDEQVTALIVLEPGTISLEMTQVPTMSGTVKNTELNNFTEQQIKSRQELERILEDAQNRHKAGTLDEAMNKKLEADFNNQRSLMQKDVYDFVSKNILNEIGEFFFTIYASDMQPSQLELLYALSTTDFQEAPLIKTLMHQQVWSLGKLREGKKFEGIELKSQDGTIENISPHFEKGNVVLIDFWASWCPPCIKSMPIIVKLYDRYKDSGFEIVGISLDENESSWKSAIKRLGMTWPQYIDDGNGSNGLAAREYNIRQIPQTYLLDKKGNIAGHNLSGVELIEKIEELLEEE